MILSAKNKLNTKSIEFLGNIFKKNQKIFKCFSYLDSSFEILQTKIERQSQEFQVNKFKIG